MKAEYADFDDPSYDALLSGRQQSNWLWFGLMISLVLHLALCTYFYRTRFQSAESVVLESPQTPTFKVKNVDLKALDKTSADSNAAAAKPVPDNTVVQLPDEKKSFDKLFQDPHAGVP